MAAAFAKAQTACDYLFENRMPLKYYGLGDDLVQAHRDFRSARIRLGNSKLSALVPQAQMVSELLIDGTEMKDITDDIASFVNLEVLIIGSARSLGTVSERLATLPHLREVRLGECEYSLNPVEYSKAQVEALLANPNITCLRLYLLDTADVRYACIANMPKLKTLEAIRSEVLTIPNLNRCPNLDTIRLGNVFFFPKSFFQLDHLRCLEIRYAKAEIYLSSEFAQLQSLEKIVIEGKCSFSGEGVGMLNNLRSLKVGWMEASDLEVLSQLQNLEELSLGVAAAKLPASWAALKHLRSFTLDDPILENLPDAMGQWHELEELHLAAKQVRIFPESFRGLKNLRILEMIPSGFGNRIFNPLTLETPEGKFVRSDFRSLPKWMGELSHLELISITYSGLRDIAPLVNCHHLRRIVLHDNAIRRFPSGLESLPELDSLDLYFNKIQGIERLDFSEKIRHVNLSSNHISHFPTIHSLSDSLEILDLSSNRIHRLPDFNGGWEGIREIDLRSNPISLVPESYGKLSGTRLDLGYAPLKYDRISQAVGENRWIFMDR